jgi:molybdate transport system ATP-binding protein
LNGIDARFRLRRPGFALDVEFALPARGATSLFGASGAGKTTVLRCLAGLERAPESRLAVLGETWQDEGRGLFVPPWRRRVGYVPQEAGLFAHLRVRDNLRYGMRRVPAEQRAVDFAQVVDWLGLGPFVARRPASLSGGERQRVAIGRALLTSPRLLLLDEPLSALDERSRRAILPYLEALPERLAVPIVFVSHALPEVARLCERMVWIDGGRVRATGPTTSLLGSVDLAVADGDALGAVLLATVVAHDDEDHLTELAVPGGTFFVRRVDRAPGARVRVQVPARDVSLALDPEPHSSILNVLRCAVLDLSPAGAGRTTVRLRPLDAPEGTVLLARITTRSARALGLGPGATVFARVKSVGLLS